MPKSSRSKHKPKHKPSQSASALFINIPKELQRIAALIDDGDWGQALQKIKDLAEQAPHRADVFETLLLVASRLNDTHEMLEAALRLVELQPYVAEHQYNLYAVYMKNHLPALAIQAGRNFLSRWPNSKMGKELPEQFDKIGKALREQPIVAQFSEESWVDIFALHERVGMENSRGNYEQAILCASQLLAQAPNFIPAYNNRSIAYWLKGELKAALADTQRALELEPDNFHALGNLARLQRLNNDLPEAQATAERLKAAQSDNPEIWSKQAETFTYLADDATVLEIAERAEAAGMFSQEYKDIAHLCFYAGVAAARLGDEKRARHLLNEALKHRPSLQHAKLQLQDLDKPVGERDGVWALTLDHWIPRRQVEEFIKIMQDAARKSDTSASKAAGQKFLKSYPQVAALVPVMLERGDSLTRDLAQQMARIAATPEMLQTLKGFALSANGPDRVRHQVLAFLQEAGVIAKREKVPFWSRGQVTEINLINYTIDDVPYEHVTSPPVVELLGHAHVALIQNEPARAEQLLQQALQLEPDSVSVRYNLSLAYLKQGQVTQARELLGKIAAEHPRYAMARCQLALFAIANDQKEEAHEQLKALADSEHFQRLEYMQFCRAQIFFYTLSEPDHAMAKQWLDLWARTAPNDPQIESLREILDNRLKSKAWARQVLAPMRK